MNQNCTSANIKNACNAKLIYITLTTRHIVTLLRKIPLTFEKTVTVSMDRLAPY